LLATMEKRKRNAPARSAEYAGEREIEESVRPDKVPKVEPRVPVASQPIIKVTLTQPVAELSPEEHNLLGKYAVLRDILASRRTIEVAEEASIPSADAEQSVLAMLAAMQEDNEKQPQHRASKRGPTRQPPTDSSPAPT
jgi:hypothetical protein